MLLFFDFCYSKNVKIASFPFETVGNFVVVTIKINHSSSLKMILDSGLKNTLVSEIFPGDKIEINSADTITLRGLGDEKQLKALKSTNNSVKIKKYQLDKNIVYFLSQDLFNLSKILGRKINGILGSNIFKNNIVEINYSSGKINIYSPDGFVAPNGYEWLPMQISKDNKMYIDVEVKEEKSDTNKRVKVLLDTGAETTAWFQTNNENGVNMSEKHIYGVIGEGLSGKIMGNFSRIKELTLGSCRIENPIVAFPDSAAISDVVQMINRNGTIGSQILKRFNLIFDSINKRLYFKKNLYFGDLFDYNISGIVVNQSILYLPIYEVGRVWEGSKGEKAGIRENDVICEINGESMFTKTLPELLKILSTPSTIPIDLLIKRNEKYIHVQLDMKDEL